MKKLFEQFKKTALLTKNENKVLENRISQIWEKYGPKKDFTLSLLFKFTILGITIIATVFTLLLLHPNLKFKDIQHIKNSNKVSAKELIQNMIYKVETYSRSGNTAHLIYEITDYSTSLENPVITHIESFYDLDSFKYKILRNVKREKDISTEQDTSENELTIYHTPIEYETYFNGKNFYLVQFNFDPENYGQNAQIYKNDYYQNLFFSMNAIDPLYENAKAYELILNLIEEENVREDIIEVKAQKFEAYNIIFFYDIEVWDSILHNRKLLRYEISLFIDKKTFLPLRQMMRRADQDMYLISVDYIMLNYINFTNEEKENLYTLNIDTYKNSVIIEDERFSTAKSLGIQTISGKVGSQYTGETYTSSILETENDNYILDGTLMSDWDSTGIPTNLALFLIGKNIEVTGSVIEINGKKHIYVEKYSLN